MHRYRLYGLFVDVPSPEAAASVNFWAAALGAAPAPDPGDGTFTILHGASTGIEIDVQAIGGPGTDGIPAEPRYHVDIETDDVGAETARLTVLGAVVVSEAAGYNVLRAPGGHLLCVVPVQSDPAVFATNAKTAG